MFRRRTLTLMLAVALLAALPATAAASALSKVQNAFLYHGTVRACEFPASTLGAALREVEGGTYDAQYLEYEAQAIQAALNAAAGGHCHHASSAGGGAETGGTAGGAGAGTSGTAAGASAQTSLPSGGAGEPASVTAATASGLAAPIVILALVVAVLALLAGATGLGRLFGWDPLWLADWRHASAEAGFRVSSAWAQLADRVRARGR